MPLYTEIESIHHNKILFYNNMFDEVDHSLNNFTDIENNYHQNHQYNNFINQFVEMNSSLNNNPMNSNHLSLQSSIHNNSKKFHENPMYPNGYNNNLIQDNLPQNYHPNNIEQYEHSYKTSNTQESELLDRNDIQNDLQNELNNDLQDSIQNEIHGHELHDSIQNEVSFLMGNDSFSQTESSSYLWNQQSVLANDLRKNFLSPDEQFLVDSSNLMGISNSNDSITINNKTHPISNKTDGSEYWYKDLLESIHQMEEYNKICSYCSSERFQILNRHQTSKKKSGTISTIMNIVQFLENMNNKSTEKSHFDEPHLINFTQINKENYESLYSKFLWIEREIESLKSILLKCFTHSNNNVNTIINFFTIIEEKLILIKSKLIQSRIDQSGSNGFNFLLNKSGPVQCPLFREIPKNSLESTKLESEQYIKTRSIMSEIDLNDVIAAHKINERKERIGRGLTYKSNDASYKTRDKFSIYQSPDDVRGNYKEMQRRWKEHFFPQIAHPSSIQYMEIDTESNHESSNDISSQSPPTPHRSEHDNEFNNRKRKKNLDFFSINLQNNPKRQKRSDESEYSRVQILKAKQLSRAEYLNKIKEQFKQIKESNQSIDEKSKHDIDNQGYEDIQNIQYNKSNSSLSNKSNVPYAKSTKIKTNRYKSLGANKIYYKEDMELNDYNEQLNSEDLDQNDNEFDNQNSKSFREKKPKEVVSFLTATIDVLKEEKRPLSIEEISHIILSRGLVTSKGKTPQQTIAARCYTYIKKMRGESLIKKVQPGVFQYIERNI